jgi:hypothetical protein
MDMNSFLPSIVAAFIVVLGWAVAYRYFMRQKRVERFRELRLTLLMDTYQELIFAINNHISTQADFDRFYRSIQNCWLLGTPEHIELAEKAIKDVANQVKSQAMQTLLYSLHNEIRREFGLSKTELLATLVDFHEGAKQGAKASNETEPVPTSVL